ncbi:hypothetical protein JCM8547_002796 [Rhodosporidiobolus lusitaniae]
MPLGLRRPPPVLSPTAQLVIQLQNFGKDEPAYEPDLDAETENVAVVGGSKAQSSDQKPQKGKKHKQGGAVGTAVGEDADAMEQMGNLSLKDGAAPAGKDKKTPKSIRNLLRSTNHTVTVKGADGKDVKRVLTSWKMADYAYKREPCPYPTRARGLFTEKIAGDKEGEQEEYQIVARGYDKFFNVGEVSWTHWDKISAYSTGPYELTTKSNGCIILIGALDERNIIVTSKHSIGKNANLSTEGGVSHSERGEYWLDKHVKSVGKSMEDLAKELYKKKLTAVAELCDDSFEEHVLAYPSEFTGLHLHGLNHNSPVLHTLPSSEVSAFAKAWGMIITTYTTFPSVPAVKTYCDRVREAGGVEDEQGEVTPVEGFVVRGHRKGGAPGEAFFWKVKYDEPYLMYREWRELTRKLLSAYPKLDAVALNRIRNEESRLYVWWVKREMERDHAKFAPWKHGKGIIRTRGEFLEWCKTPEAKTTRRELGLQVEMDEEERKNRKFDKTIVVPIAIQGCGKTALGLELSHLFGWGHVQSDDFLQKKPAPHFLKAIKELLQKKDIVYADKNNHTIKHRTDITTLAESLSPANNVRLIALVWPTNTDTLPRDKFHALCSSRIVIRGENHQTLRAGEGHEQVIWQFLGQHESFEPAGNAADAKFDHVVEMRAEWSQEEALKHAVEELSKIEGVLPKETEVPLSPAKVEEAINHARGWKTKVKKEAAPVPQQQSKPRGKGKEPRYYGLSVDLNVQQFVLEHLPKHEKDDKSSLWNALVKSSRVEKNPHVTLVHRAELDSKDKDIKAAKQALWDRYSGLVDAATKFSSAEDVEQANEAKAKLKVELTLGPRLAWDGRAMSLEVSAIEPKLKPKQGEKPHIELVDGRHAHITVGTKASDIRPVEGKWLMEAVEKGETESKEGGKIHVVTLSCSTKVPGKLAGLS